MRTSHTPRAFLLAVVATLALIVRARSAAAAPGPLIVKQRPTRETPSNPPKPAARPLLTTTLSPVHLATGEQESIKQGANFFIVAPATSQLPDPTNLYVGYLHDTNGKDPQGNGYEARNEFYRGGLRFDVSALAGHTIETAVLNLRVYSTHHRGVHSNPDTWDKSSSCAVQVVNAKSDWWQDPHPQPMDIGDITIPIPANAAADFQVDVTPIVRSWMASATANYGLVLMGDDEHTDLYTETICQSQYIYSGDGAPTLVVTYR
jgi:hypothetical protein